MAPTQEKDFFGKNAETKKMVDALSDEEIENLNRGGHDPTKVYNAYKRAYSEKNRPTVILAFTVKGYGIGSRQADNATHQVKKLSDDAIKNFIDTFNLPVKFNETSKLDYLTLDKESKKYLIDRRKELGGFLPSRKCNLTPLAFSEDNFDVFMGAFEKELSTTMIFVRILTKLLRDKEFGSRVVPIVPDEARTFGMDSLFRQFGIYSSQGQKYEPEDIDKVMFYRESESGVMLEEGINEAGAFSAWLALATSYANNNHAMVPFYIYYSMFGFQRIHDLAWAAGDSRAKGFLLGATSGRTTLNGEGLQHQDGHSHIISSTIPNCKSYDPCFSYELATIIKKGLEEMYVKNLDVYYYITLMNENYSHPKAPKNICEDEIIKGCYKFQATKDADIRLLASGVALNFAIDASKILSDLGVNVEIWSVTSFNELYRDGIEHERKNLLNGTSSKSYVKSCFEKNIPTIAVSDYQRAYVNQIRQWISGTYLTLGTDGYGRSDTREKLREFFEVDANTIAFSALRLLGRDKEAESILNKKYKNSTMEEIKIIELKIPNLGEAESTEVIEISVKEGDSININDPLIVLESEKAAMEVPSDYEGEIVKITIKEGENVSEGQIFGEIKAFQSFEEEKVIKKEIPKEPEPTEHISNSLDQSEIKFKGINAGPAVRKYARELDIDLTKIDGSGKNSRITKDDLKNFIHGSANKSVNTYADIEDLKSFGNFELVNQSKIKRIGAKTFINHGSQFRVLLILKK